MARMGVDPDQITRTKGVFDQQALAIADLTSKLSNEVQNNVGAGKPAWEGPRADTFATTWNSEFKPALDKLRTALEEASRELQKALQDATAALG